MKTSEYKAELKEGKINNAQLASYILDADEDVNYDSPKFVWGFKYDDDYGDHIIVFVSEGLFIPKENKFIFCNSFK